MLDNGPRDEDIQRKGHPLSKVAPFVLELALWLVWMVVSPMGILHSHTFLVCATVGIINAYITSRMILCRVCDMPIPQFYFIIAPLPLLVANALLPWCVSGFTAPLVDEVTSLFAYLVYIAILYCHFVYVTITSLTQHLGIYAFSLKPRSSTLSDIKKA